MSNAPHPEGLVPPYAVSPAETVSVEGHVQPPANPANGEVQPHAYPPTGEVQPHSYPPDSAASGGPLSRPPPAHSPRTNSPAYLTAVYEGLEHEELVQGAPRLPLDSEQHQQRQNELNEKAFIAWRSRIRKTYMVPFITWLPSFALILYFSFKNSGPGGSYQYGFVALWVLVLVATFFAYRSKYKRLRHARRLGVLPTLTDDQVWDYIMNSGELPPAPAYDIRDEPLPLYACADDDRHAPSVRSVPSVGTLEMMRRPAAEDFQMEERRTVVAEHTAGGQSGGISCSPPAYAAGDHVVAIPERPAAAASGTSSAPNAAPAAVV
ncbi:hypothetical protein HDU86_003137 [Geranomyces michiganensis]|nr:hypothetical protein HDU86_003137 [Geranomyces michiganensis]